MKITGNTRKRLALGARLTSLAIFVLVSAAASADVYPVNGVWINPNHDFPVGADQACSTLRLWGVDAVTRKSIAQLLIFNQNKRYDVTYNNQTVSTLHSAKPITEGYLITETPDIQKRFWIRQKITYLLTMVDPTTIEIRSNLRRTRFVKCGPRGKLSI